MVGPKKQDFKAKNKNIQRKMMVHQKVPKSYFQSRFKMSKIKDFFHFLSVRM
jgi:hypothetical protein